MCGHNLKLSTLNYFNCLYTLNSTLSTINFPRTPQTIIPMLIFCIQFKEFKGSSSSRDSLKDLLVELRSHFPEAMIFGIREIGDYFIKVSDEMNQLRLELSDMP